MPTVEPDPAAQPVGFGVLFEDYHCIGVAKPAGLATQAPPGIESLEAAVKSYIARKYGKPGNVYLGVPHRLDRPVSGAVVFARNTKAARRLAEQFASRRVEKVYWAAVEGVTEGNGTWEDWLRKLPDAARSEVVAEGEAGAQSAVLHWSALRRLPGERTHLELRPVTGRTHQLRVQSAARGLPIVGDELYGARSAFGPPGDPRARAIALHARRLVFGHPTAARAAEVVEVVAPLPELWGRELELSELRP